MALHIWLDAPADTSLDDLVDRAMADTSAYSAEAEQRHWEKLFELLDTTLPTPAR